MVLVLHCIVSTGSLVRYLLVVLDRTEKCKYIVHGPCFYIAYRGNVIRTDGGRGPSWGCDWLTFASYLDGGLHGSIWTLAIIRVERLAARNKKRAERAIVGLLTPSIDRCV